MIAHLNSGTILLQLGLMLNKLVAPANAALDHQAGDSQDVAASRGGGADRVWAPAGNGQLDSWNYWWSYSGPSYWGLLNPDWFMCDKGRRQSPVSISTRNLVYDPHLKPLKIDNNLISGVLHNDGHSIALNCSLAARVFALVNVRRSSSANISATGANDDGSKGAQLANFDASEQPIGPGSQRVGRRQAPPADAPLLFTLADANPPPDEKSAAAAGAAPSLATALMKDLSQNIELSIGQGDRLAASQQQALLRREAALDATGPQQSNVTLAEHTNELEMLQQQQQQQAEDEQPVDLRHSVQLSGAGLAYSYRLEIMHLRFGLVDGFESSEHQIDGRSFSAELQLFAFNWQLYDNFGQAASKPNGLLAIALLIDLVDNEANQTGASSGVRAPNRALEMLAERASSALMHRGQFETVHELSLNELLGGDEASRELLTYEGSLSWPGCHESVTWLLLNRRIYMTRSSLEKLRSISADELTGDQSASGTLVAGNVRPIQPLNSRPIRTNIRPSSVRAGEQETCARLWTQYEYKSSST